MAVSLTVGANPLSLSLVPVGVPPIWPPRFCKEFISVTGWKTKHVQTAWPTWTVKYHIENTGNFTQAYQFIVRAVAFDSGIRYIEVGEIQEYEFLIVSTTGAIPSLEEGRGWEISGPTSPITAFNGGIEVGQQMWGEAGGPYYPIPTVTGWVTNITDEWQSFTLRSSMYRFGGFLCIAPSETWYFDGYTLEVADVYLNDRQWLTVGRDADGEIFWVEYDPWS